MGKGTLPGSALGVGGGHAGAEASATTAAGWRRPSSPSQPRAMTGEHGGGVRVEDVREWMY